jgi:hypothetical protein
LLRTPWSPVSGLSFSSRRAADRRDAHPPQREVVAAELGAAAAVANAAWIIVSAFIPAGVIIAGAAVIAVLAAIAATQVLQNTRRSAEGGRH